MNIKLKAFVSPLLILIFASLFAVYGTIYLSKSFLVNEEIPVGDFAADMLLERKIDDRGFLLTGHYSRFEFNHPGIIFVSYC